MLKIIPIESNLPNIQKALPLQYLDRIFRLKASIEDGLHSGTLTIPNPAAKTHDTVQLDIYSGEFFKLNIEQELKLYHEVRQRSDEYMIAEIPDGDRNPMIIANTRDIGTLLAEAQSINQTLIRDERITDQTLKAIGAQNDDLLTWVINLHQRLTTATTTA